MYSIPATIVLLYYTTLVQPFPVADEPQPIQFEGMRSRLDLVDIKPWDNRFGQKREIDLKDYIHHVKDDLHGDDKKDDNIGEAHQSIGEERQNIGESHNEVKIDQDNMLKHNNDKELKTNHDNNLQNEHDNELKPKVPNEIINKVTKNNLEKINEEKEVILSPESDEKSHKTQEEKIPEYKDDKNDIEEQLKLKESSLKKIPEDYDDNKIVWNMNIKKFVENPLIPTKNEKIILPDSKQIKMTEELKVHHKTSNSDIDEKIEDADEDQKKLVKEEYQKNRKEEGKKEESEKIQNPEVRKEEEFAPEVDANEEKNKTLKEEEPDGKDDTNNETFKNKHNKNDDIKLSQPTMEDPMTPVPYSDFVPKPSAEPSLKTTPMPTTIPKQSTISLKIEVNDQGVVNKDEVSVYLPKKHFDRIAEMTRDGQPLEVKFIDEHGYFDEKLELDPIKEPPISKTTVSHVDPITTDQLIPTVAPPSPTTPGTVTVKETVMSFLSKLAAALKCTKRDCSSAIKDIRMSKRKQLKEHSTPPRRIRQADTETRKCSCRS